MRLVFSPAMLTASHRRLQEQVRAFLAEELPLGSYKPGLGLNAAHSPGFSRRLAARGWVGMSFPRAYGGHGRSALERFVVLEELLRVGAPVGAHFIADRQSGPLILRYGTDGQKHRFLPAIARGECFFSIGMSEPDAGSDLAAVTTSARRVEGGWRLSGTKIWTSNAHLNHYFVVLCRTSPATADRHQGLTQMIVDLRASGLTVRPIELLDGSHHFNEVSLDEVFVDDELVLGRPGSGWVQVSAELSYERGGPERFLSIYPLLEEFLAQASVAAPSIQAGDAVGQSLARLWAIRQLSLAVADQVDRNRQPAVEAALVKDLGTRFEQQVIDAVQRLVPNDPDPSSADTFEALLAESISQGPSYTIRGGTSEILRTVVSQGLRRGREVAPATSGDDQAAAGSRSRTQEARVLFATLVKTLERVCPPATVRAAERSGWSAQAWAALSDGAFLRIGVPESAGGSGGGLVEACAVLQAVGRSGLPGPVGETMLAGWLLAAGGLPIPDGPLSLPVPHAGDALRLWRDGDLRRLDARLGRVPWATRASRVVLYAKVAGEQGHILSIDPSRFTQMAGRSLAGEPRASLSADALSLSEEELSPAPAWLDERWLLARAALLRASQMSGAMDRIADLCLAYVEMRHQFGRPIAAFQAVQQHLVTVVEEAALVRQASEVAAAACEREQGSWVPAAIAKSVAGESAGPLTASAHQLHGAMGMTYEYDLQLWSRRLWVWRQEFGSSDYWWPLLATEARTVGARNLYPWLTGFDLGDEQVRSIPASLD
ncbi:MAG: acyl-CoA dehydrogenase family protein [Mycobacteriales bacterium]